MDSEEIDRELFQLERYWLSQSKLEKIPDHQQKITDIAFVKNSFASAL
jgi:hypothetical protein